MNVNVFRPQTRNPAYLKQRKIILLCLHRNIIVRGSLEELPQYDNTPDKSATGIVGSVRRTTCRGSPSIKKASKAGHDAF